MKIHHIGYLVKKIEKAISAFTDLGYIVEKETIYDSYRDIDICFLIKDGYRVELVSPKSKNSVVYEMYKNTGNSPYHICYETDDPESDIKWLLDNNYILCDEKHPAVALENREVCFFVHPYMGMIELLEV